MVSIIKVGSNIHGFTVATIIVIKNTFKDICNVFHSYHAKVMKYNIISSKQKIMLTYFSFIPVKCPIKSWEAFHPLDSYPLKTYSKFCPMGLYWKTSWWHTRFYETCYCAVVLKPYCKIGKRPKTFRSLKLSSRKRFHCRTAPVCYCWGLTRTFESWYMVCSPYYPKCSLMVKLSSSIVWKTSELGSCLP